MTRKKPTPVTDYSDSTSRIRRGRGRAQESLDLILKAYEILDTVQPTTVRSVAYRLFVNKVIESMEDKQVARVGRLLGIAREDGTIPWEWIVDVTRRLVGVAQWNDPACYLKEQLAESRRNCWNYQPFRVEVWIEKGTVEGILWPVLAEYGVNYRVTKGWAPKTLVHDAATTNPEQPLIVLYVGDWDPSGLYMSEVDLPKRVAEYGGDHVEIRRVAVTEADTVQLGPSLSFPAKTKKKDPRYKWFVREHGNRCWELEAMESNVLRDRVEAAIVALIEPEAWQRCKRVGDAQEASLRAYLDQWPKSKSA